MNRNKSRLKSVSTIGFVASRLSYVIPYLYDIVSLSQNYSSFILNSSLDL